MVRRPSSPAAPCGAALLVACGSPSVCVSLCAGTGVVEYETEDDMKYAVRKLDDSEFVSTYTRSKGVIRVKEDRGSGGGGGGSGGGGRDRSRDRERRRSKSRSRTPPRRGRSPSPAAEKKRSPSRSASPRKPEA